MSYRLALLALWCISLAISAYRPLDPFTWFLEVAPAIIGIADHYRY